MYLVNLKVYCLMSLSSHFCICCTRTRDIGTVFNKKLSLKSHYILNHSCRVLNGPLNVLMWTLTNLIRLGCRNKSFLKSGHLPNGSCTCWPVGWVVNTIKLSLPIGVNLWIVGLSGLSSYKHRLHYIIELEVLCLT